MHKKHILLFLLVLILASFHAEAQKKERGHRHKSGSSNTMIDRKRVTEIFLDATKARIIGDIEKAKELYQNCLDIDPENDAAMYELSQISFDANDFAGAAGFIEKAIEIDPDNQYYRLLSLDIYGKSGRKDDLLKTCVNLVKMYPDNLDYKYELATAYLMQGKNDDAIETYDNIEKVIGVSEEISLQKQRILMLQNKPEKACEEISKLLEAFPDEAPRYYSMLAEINMQMNKPEKAAEYYQKIVEADPTNPYVHISLSDYYRKKGNSSQAFEELKLGFANPSLDVDTKVRILTTYYSVQEIYGEKKDEALELSELMVKAHPKDVKTISLRGDLLLNDKKFAEAHQYYTEAIAIDSSHYSIWENLIQADASLSDWPALYEESARAVDLFPFQPIPYFFNGVACLQLHKSKEAVKVLTSGSKLVVDNQNLLVQFYSNLGDAYNQLSQHDQSDEYYEKSLKLDPDNSYVLNNYSYYLSLRGVQLDKALNMARKGAMLDSLNPANLDTYGWVLYKLGKYDQAKTWVEKALLAVGKDDSDILEHYGDILYKLGEPQKALEYWEKALKAGAGTEFLEQKVKLKKLIE